MKAFKIAFELSMLPLRFCRPLTIFVYLNVEGALAVVIVGVFALEALKAIGMNESPEHASEE